jgi:hypothetical protein
MRTTRLNLFATATLTLLLALGTSTMAAAQGGGHAQAPTPHMKSVAPAAKPAKPRSPEAVRAGNLKSFGGIAKKLNTTPEALPADSETVLQANPNLKRGQFIAANVLAQNLGARNPAITTQAILDGLKSGKSIGQTLHSLGLSASDAKLAAKAADKEVAKAKNKATKTAAKDQSPAPKPSN